MKKIMKVVLIASLVMAAALAGVMIYMNQVKDQQTEDSELEKVSELDILSDDIEKISFTEEDEITPLYLTGKKKNVITYDDASLSDIYTTEYTKQIDKQLKVEKKRGSRRIDNAVWAWNPYGTQPMSLYVYFLTRENYYVTYTISVDNKNIPDFSRTLNNHNSGNLTQTHEYSIVGLIPGKKNYITLRLCREDGKIQKTMIYSIDVPEAPKDVKTKISMTKGYNQNLLANGLYVVYGNNVKSKAKSYLLFYDNSGYLRSYIPLKSFAAENIQEMDGCLLFPCSKNQFALMSPTGQIKKMYTLDGYEMYSGFAYDSMSSLYILADSTSKKSSKHDGIIRLNLKNGNIVTDIDMGKVLSTVKAKAQKNSKGKGSLNWIDLNSIQYMEGQALLLSSRELSSVILLKNVNRSKPVVKSIIGEKILWHGTGWNKKIAKKAESFTAQFGQHTVFYADSGAYVDLTPETDEEGNVVEEPVPEDAKQYYIYMFNNNYGDSKTLPSINYKSFQAGTKKKPSSWSYYCQYLYDETENMYKLTAKTELPFSAEYGSVQICDGNLVAGSSENKVFMEYTPDGKMLHTYKTGFVFSRVEKKDMKQFWFL
jgi:hypothetical protein